MSITYYGWDNAPSDFDLDLDASLTALFKGGLASGGYGGYFYRADKEVYSDTGGTVPAVEGSPVKLWRDLSGNGAHLSTLFGTDPIYRHMGGRSVQFDGTKSIGALNKNTDHSNFELFLKVEGTGVADSNGPRMLYEGVGTTASNDGFATSDLALVGNWTTSQFAMWGFSSKALNTPGGGGMTAPGVYNLQKRGNTVTIFKDGVQVATLGGIASSNPAAGASRLVIGAGSYAALPNRFRPFTGRYGALLRFDGVLTDDQRQMILDFMSNFDIEVRNPITFGALQGTVNTNYKWYGAAFGSGKVLVQSTDSIVYNAGVSTQKDNWNPAVPVWTSGNKASTAQAMYYNPSIDEFISLGQSNITHTKSDLSSAVRVVVGVAGDIWRRMAYSPALNLMAAVAVTGKIATSPDGVTWTIRTSGLTAASGIVWCDDLGLFVAVGGSKRSVSADGVTWTATSIGPLDGTTVDLAYSEDTGKLVALQNAPYAVYVSSDAGETWTKTAVTATLVLNSVMWIGGTWNMFVITGNNRCITSPDGLAWTDIPVPAGNYVQAAFNPTDDTLLFPNYTNGQVCFAELT